jgi:putative Mg2+ transporter-C (MgtC) family protein
MLDAITGEFADLSAAQTAQLVVRLVLAGVLAAVLGWNRERIGKAAGFRTHILVALGAAGFAAVPLVALGPDAAGRVLQGVAAGIGFLGAGCIVKAQREESVHGLTTAAGIWLTAAVGVTAGLGRGGSAILLAAAGWFTLAILGRFEHHHTPQSNPG